MAFRSSSLASASKPLIDLLVPLRDARLATLVKITLGVAFLALLAQVRIQVGPVPITGQTLGVMLLGAGYGATLGLTTVLAYLLAGGFGLAVFSGGAAGWAVLSGPTGGYLLAMPIAVALIGSLAARGWDRKPLHLAFALLLATLVIYTLGVAWLARFAPDLSTTLAWGVWPFLPGDALKILLAAGALPLARRLLAQRSKRA